MSDLDKTHDIKESVDAAEAEICLEKQDKILRKYSKEDDKRKLNKTVGTIVNIIAGLLALFMIYTGMFGSLPALRQRSLYLLFTMVILFLVYPAFTKSTKKGVSWYDYIFALLSFFCCGYVVLYYEHILKAWGISNQTEQVLFVILAILILEGTRRLVSGALALITLLFLLYGYFGYLAPGIFKIDKGGISRLTDHLYMIPEGIFGVALGAAVGYVALFVIFSSLLQVSGMGDLFRDVTMALTGRATGGPAKMAVVASAMFGSISGSAAANVVGTGTFTIPLMKKCGYPGEFAGAVESCSSTGGQLVPPVMGAAAFIMTEYIGVPYAKIMIAGLIPAFLYYFAVFMTVDLRSRKLGLLGIPKEDLPDVKKVIKEKGHLIIPFAAVIYLIIRQYTISFAAIVGIFLVIICAQARKTTRMSIKTIVSALINGAKKTVAFGISCACVGLIIGITTLTNIGITLGNYILDISRGDLFLSLILVMIMSIILGMGMPTVAVYIVMATVAAPVLVKLGVPVLAAHFFSFYFGILACITPPVAVPSYAAAALAGSHPGKTGWIAFRMAFPTFLVPYIFVYAPSILFIDAIPTQVIWVTFTCIIGIILISMANEGYLFSGMSVWKRILSFVGGILCVLPETTSDYIGIGIFVLLVAIQYLYAKREKTEVKIAT